MAERKQCEFQLIRYVPDPVKNEFVNIGVVLRDPQRGQTELRFTRDWSRVHCLDPDADTEMLKALESEVGQRLKAEQQDDPRSILRVLEDSLSNGVQITEAKAHLSETFRTSLEDLMHLYVDNPPRERSQKRGGRAAIQALIRTRFEGAGVWSLMRKQIAAAEYTEPGDPLRIDCGYRNQAMKMFQAISLETDPADAKLLAYSADSLREGVLRREKVELELTAITEPLVWPEGDNEPDRDRKEKYKYASDIMDKHKVRMMTTADLKNIADTARRDLHV
jgi:hypothetical protein